MGECNTDEEGEQMQVKGGKAAGGIKLLGRTRFKVHLGVYVNVDSRAE